MTKGLIKEIFTSIQGEALYIGQQQLFIRFCGCNLNCNYCDTNFRADECFYFHDYDIKIKNPIIPQDLKKLIDKSKASVISLTGGEPLVQVDFLEEFLLIISDKKFYLETNGSMPDELKRVIKYTDVISMDIKLECSTKQPATFDKNAKFIEIAGSNNKEIFAKIVLDKNYKEDEVIAAITLVKEYNVPLIVQPMDCKNKTLELNKNDIKKLFDLLEKEYDNWRYIPQVHKFLHLL